MKDNKAARSKRGTMVINLVETPSGFSIIEGANLLNKPAPQQPRVEAPALPAPAPVYQPPAPKEPPKMAVKQNNLFFLRAPSEPDSLGQPAETHTVNTDVGHCSKFAHWFRIEEVSEIEKQQIRLWVGEQIGNKSNLEGELPAWVEKYRRHRNTIMEIYYKQYAPNQGYLSASAVRKYIPEDARWLMKIHIFLTSWGLINSTRINFENEHLVIADLFMIRPTGEYGVVSLDSSYYSQKPTKLHVDTDSHSYDVLKRATATLRPYCDYCGIHCQMVWFQHMRAIDPKEISTIMKNVNSKNPPLSEKQYEIILCVKCYCNGNFPLLLTHKDFKKITLNDKLEPGKKKKSNKNKKKEKKRKLKEKQMMEEDEEYKEEAEEAAEQEPKPKDKQSEDNLKQEEKQSDDKKHINGAVNGSGKEQKANGIDVNPNQAEKQTSNVDEIIQEIVKSVKNQRRWTLEQTAKILQTIQKEGDNWDAIYKNLQAKGFCRDCQPEDIIMHFIKLPLLNVSELVEHNSAESFVKENHNQTKSNFLTKRVQANLDNCVKIAGHMSQTGVKLSNPSNEKLKQLLDRFAGIYTHKIMSEIELLSRLQAKAVQEHRRFEQATKSILLQ